MRVLHLSTNDLRGGASKSMYRLHRQLIEAGVDSRVASFHKQSQDPTVTKIEWADRLDTKIEVRLRQKWLKRRKERYLSNRPAGTEMFSDYETTFPHRLLEPHLQGVDVINLHWVNGFIDLKPFFNKVAGRIPVVWRLSDMNPLTGGCHYDMECGKFLRGCGHCPQLASSGASDFSKRAFERQRKVFEKLESNDLYFVLQSQWMEKLLGEHPYLARFPRKVIPNGIDAGKFDPHRREIVLPQVGQDGKIKLLMVAGAIEDPRKGGAILKSALEQLNEATRQKLHVLSVGVGECSFEIKGLSHTHLGKLEDYQQLADVYNFADIVVVPSLQDNLPSSILEAMAGRCCIIASNVGGIPDLVENDVQALLYPPKDVNLLTRAIETLVADAAMRNRMVESAQQRVISEFSIKTQAARFVECYQEAVVGAKH